MPEPKRLPQRLGDRFLGVPGPSIPDLRDWLYPAAMGAPRAATRHFIETRLPADQGRQGSCVAHAMTHAFETDALVNDGIRSDLSRAFLYYEARRVQGWQNEDTGAFIRDAIEVLRVLGIPSENAFPYDAKDFRTAPPASANAEARRNRASEYRSCPMPAHVLAALERDDAVVLCFTVYESFEKTGETGLWTVPSGAVLGGHCVPAIGFDLERPAPAILCANSWGLEWGAAHPLAEDDERFAEHVGGYFWLPLDVVASSVVWDVFSIHRSALVT